MTTTSELTNPRHVEPVPVRILTETGFVKPERPELLDQVLYRRPDVVICDQCDRRPNLQSSYPPEFRNSIISCLTMCWGCANAYFIARPLELAESVSRGLSANAERAQSRRDRINRGDRC